MDNNKEHRKSPPKSPGGLSKLKYYGPGLLWMISSVGSGTTLFTPRVGSRFGYELIWMAVLVILLKFIMVREVGRYTVITGKSLLSGFKDIPGPGAWAVWLIFVPQLAAASVTIAGVAALAGSALMIAFPGEQWLYAPGLIVISIILVLTGKYKGVEWVSLIMAIILVIAAVSAAIIVMPSAGTIAPGFVPGLPENFDLYFVLPWAGFILTGAGGIIMYSYWISARGFTGEKKSEIERGKEDSQKKEIFERLRTWNSMMTKTILAGIVTGGLVLLAFLVLGAEILRPEGIIPEGIDVARDLTRLLSEVWGMAGYWILLLGIFIALWGTIFTNQDGQGRVFADATLLLLGEKRINKIEGKGGMYDRLIKRSNLKNAYSIVILTIIPLALFFLLREPVEILSIGGIIAAAHMPIVAFLTIYLNMTKLPDGLRPGWMSVTLQFLSILFFAVFAIIYFLDLLGIRFF